MNVWDFARQHLYPYKVRGNEIIAKYCPFCKGGAHHDKESFALNADKQTYNCHRGSCGAQGHFTQLCKEFGEVADKMDNYEMYRPKREYKKPVTVTKDTTNEAEEYCKLRKISKETMNVYGVSCDDKGNIVFPYFENGIHVMNKFRPAKKVLKGEMKAWREEGGKPVLWGMDICEPEKPLIITEGEMDTLSCYESGAQNVVSVPSGSEDFTWVDLCWDWLKQFQEIILFGDNDEPGREMIRKLTQKLSEYKLYVVENKYKDANELLFYEGSEAVMAAIRQAKEIPVHGLLNLYDVKPLDVRKLDRVKSNIYAIDSTIGGFVMGELSVWTGKRGHGKSTFLGQLLLECVEQDTAVCAYSGELRADKFQYWVHLQAAGPEGISKYYDTVKGKDITYVDKDTTQAIKEWYKGKFYLYDNEIATDTEEASILKIFTYAAKRHNCRVFLVDNLMTANFQFANDKDYYRAQSSFVGKLKDFANKFNVHVHLVAHPRKTNGELENDDISGTGDITNRADNTFSVERIQDKDRHEVDCDVMFKVLKNRSDGVMDEKVGLNYCKQSRRLYSPSIGNYRKYSWQKVEVVDKDRDENCPF